MRWSILSRNAQSIGHLNFLLPSKSVQASEGERYTTPQVSPLFKPASYLLVGNDEYAKSPRPIVTIPNSQ